MGDFHAFPPPNFRGGDDRRGDRDRDRDRSSRDDRRDSGRRDDRGGDRDRGRERDDRPRDRNERPSSRRSPSGSPGPRTRKPRKTKFDLLPEGVAPGTLAPVGVPMLALGALPSLLPQAAVPSLSLGGFGALPTLGSLGGMLGGMGGAGAPSGQQATRHARRIYVGGLPPSAVEQSIATFFSHALAAVGGNTAGPGNAVVNVYINREKNFSFVELRTVEETSNAMALDGIMFEGVTVRVRRPNDYNPAAAAAIGPSMPNPNLNLAAIGMAPNAGGGGGGGASSSTGPDAAERIFVGGLPYYLTEEQCRELLGSFGTIKSFDLVKDRETGMGKGYGFVVYLDPSVTDIACAGLNGLKMGDRTLTVRRAAEGAPGSNAGGGGGGLAFPTINLPGITLGGAPLFGLNAGAAAAAAAVPTRIVVLAEAVTLYDLQRDDEYNDILEDMRDEGNKHGQLLNIVIPRPTPQQPTPPGLGKVVLEFADVPSAQRSRHAMHGRRFAGRTVVGVFLPEDKYAAGLYDHVA